MNFSCPGDPSLSSSHLVGGDDVFACLESAEDDVSRRRHSSDDLDDTSDGSVFEYDIIKAGDDLWVFGPRGNPLACSGPGRMVGVSSMMGWHYLLRGHWNEF